MASRACQECRALISAFLDGEITADENTRMRQHLAGCAECRATLDAYRGIGGSIRALPPIQPPQHLTEAIFAQTIDAAPRRLFLITSRVGYSLAAVASVLLIFVVAGYLIIGGYDRSVEPKITASSPAHELNWPLHDPVRITFNKDMNEDSVIAALGIVPDAEKDRLSKTWDGNTLVIGDNTPFKPETRYEIKISTDAVDRWGKHLSQPYQVSFMTGPTLATVQTPTPSPEPTATDEVVKPASTPTRTVQPVVPTPTLDNDEGAVATPTTGNEPSGDDGGSNGNDDGNGNGNGSGTPVAPVNPMPPTATPTPTATRPAPTATATPTEPVRDVEPTPTATEAVPTATSTVPPTPSPTPTATATLPPTATPTPPTAASPTPSTVPVVGAIGDIYWGDQAVRDRLGNATTAARDFGATQLDFQQGAMLTDENGSGIYVLKFGSGWDQFGIPSDQSLTPVEVEPGLFIPGGAFGELWVTDDGIEDALGYALTRDPIGFTATAQTFDNGVIISTQSTVYVIYSNKTWDWFTRGSGG